MNLSIRWTAVLVFASLGLLAGGCGSAPAAKETPQTKSAAAPAGEKGERRMLILYYSLTGGNTKSIASALQKATGADMEAIEPETPYSGPYDDIVTQGKREVDEGYRPELRPLAHDISQYDVIAVGTPTWWYTMAPPVLTLLTSHDWSGKVIIPFQTHAGWPGHAIEDMEAAAPGAEFSLPFQARFDHQTLVTAESDVDRWAKDVADIL